MLSEIIFYTEFVFKQLNQNPFLEWFVFSILIYIAILVSKTILKNIIVKKIKTENNTIELLSVILDYILTRKNSVYVITSISIAGIIGSLESRLISLIITFFILYVVIQAVKLLNKILQFYIEKLKESKEESNETSYIRIIEIFAKIAIWTTALLFVLSNWGININSLIAGLGIGGIAIALALQNILGDLFSSLAIFLDKPFEEGDFIQFDNKMGTVEKIGLKSTRIMALDGEQIVISNNNLIKLTINNFKRRIERRVTFDINVDYDTNLDKLKKIPKIVENIIDEIDELRLHAINLYNMSDFSINFKLIYYVESNEYLTYLQTREKFNLKLLEEFKKEKINIPFPTSTIHLSNKETK